MIFKRILLISHEMTYTGAPRSLLNVARVLRAYGNYVKVATLKSGNFEKEFQKYGFWVRHYDEENYEYKLLKNKQDLVIANTIFCGKFALKAQQFVNTILYIREGENLPDIISHNGLVDDYITKSKNVVCVSEYSKNFIEKYYGVRNIYVIHNFLYSEIVFEQDENNG